VGARRSSERVAAPGAGLDQESGGPSVSNHVGPTRRAGTSAPANPRFRRAWLTACKGAGLSGRIPHDFRRTAVRNLERAGVPRSTAMKMVGHKTESIYRRYAIVDEAMLKEGAAKRSVRDGTRRRVLSRCRRARKQWWAGTGLNRRHQDFRPGPWSPQERVNV
jgi:integrase